MLWVSGVNGSPESITQHLISAMVWALSGPLQNTDFLFLNPLCSRFPLMFGIIVLLHQPISPELQVADIHPNIFL